MTKHFLLDFVDKVRRAPKDERSERRHSDTVKDEALSLSLFSLSPSWNFGTEPSLDIVGLWLWLMPLLPRLWRQQMCFLFEEENVKERFAG